jgi:hypothetical protein
MFFMQIASSLMGVLTIVFYPNSPARRAVPLGGIRQHGHRAADHHAVGWAALGR